MWYAETADSGHVLTLLGFPTESLEPHWIAMWAGLDQCTITDLMNAYARWHEDRRAYHYIGRPESIDDAWVLISVNWAQAVPEDPHGFALAKRKKTWFLPGGEDCWAVMQDGVAAPVTPYGFFRGRTRLDKVFTYVHFEDYLPHLLAKLEGDQRPPPRVRSPKLERGERVVKATRYYFLDQDVIRMYVLTNYKLFTASVPVAWDGCRAVGPAEMYVTHQPPIKGPAGSGAARFPGANAPPNFHDPSARPAPISPRRQLARTFGHDF